MPTAEELDILQAVLAVAAADGRFAHSEKGVYEGLAKRVGADATIVWSMMNRIRMDPNLRQNLFSTKIQNPQQALKLLVATARIDGEISQPERELLVEVSTQLGIAAEDFGRIYEEALTAADDIRKRAR